MTHITACPAPFGYIALVEPERSLWSDVNGIHMTLITIGVGIPHLAASHVGRVAPNTADGLIVVAGAFYTAHGVN